MISGQYDWWALLCEGGEVWNGSIFVCSAELLPKFDFSYQDRILDGNL